MFIFVSEWDIATFTNVDAYTAKEFVKVHFAAQKFNKAVSIARARLSVHTERAFTEVFGVQAHTLWAAQHHEEAALLKGVLEREETIEHLCSELDELRGACTEGEPQLDVLVFQRQFQSFLH